MQDCFHQRVFYYWRHGLIGHVILMCENATYSRNNDLFVHIWHALALGFSNQTAESLEELSYMTGRNDLSTTYLACQYIVQRHVSQNDSPQLLQLHDEILEKIPKCNAFSASTSILVAIMFNNISFAKELFNLSEQHSEVLSMGGWIELIEGNLDLSNEYFDKALQDSYHSLDIYSLYGKALYYTQIKELDEALSYYSTILAHYDFPEIYFEKSRTYFYHHIFDNIDEIPNDAIYKLISPIELYIFRALTCLIHKSNLKLAADCLLRLTSELDQYEPMNYDLYY